MAVRTGGKPKPFAADCADKTQIGKTCLGGTETRRRAGDRKGRRFTADQGGSGGLAAQLRKQPGGMDKVLDTERLPPFQACRRSQYDDPIRGLNTVTAAGNFLKEAVRTGSPEWRTVSDSFAGFESERGRSLLRVIVHGPTYLVARYNTAVDPLLSLFLMRAGDFSN